MNDTMKVIINEGFENEIVKTYKMPKGNFTQAVAQKYDERIDTVMRNKEYDYDFQTMVIVYDEQTFQSFEELSNWLN